MFGEALNSLLSIIGIGKKMNEETTTGSSAEPSKEDPTAQFILDEPCDLDSAALDVLRRRHRVIKQLPPHDAYAYLLQDLMRRHMHDLCISHKDFEREWRMGVIKKPNALNKGYPVSDFTSVVEMLVRTSLQRPRTASIITRLHGKHYKISLAYGKIISICQV